MKRSIWLFAFAVTTCLLGASDFSGSVASATEVAFFKTSHRQTVEKAIELAEEVLKQIGVPMPPVHIVPGTTDAFTRADGIFLGDRLAETLSASGVAQVLLHEVGHVYEGHVDRLSQVVDALYQLGLIDGAEYQRYSHDQEHAADVWAAVGAWMLDPNPAWPEISQWFWNAGWPDSSTHPDSQGRALRIAAWVADLYDLEDSGFFDDHGWTDGGHEAGLYPDEPGDDSDGDDGGDGSGDDGSDDDGSHEGGWDGGEGFLARKLRPVCLNDPDDEREDFPFPYYGTDLGFRYYSFTDGSGGRCLNSQGKNGYNPDCWGECGDLRGKDFRKKNLNFARWPGANFSGADFRNSLLEAVNFEGANFRRARLSGIKTAKKAGHSSFRGADFRGANLSGSQLITADFTNADFRAANLTKVWWARVFLHGAHLEGADLSSPRGWVTMQECGPVGSSRCTIGAYFDRRTRLPGMSESDAVKIWDMKKVGQK